MQSYIFPVVVEPDEDVWRAYVPDLEASGAATWGKTRDEALKNIQEVAQMVIEDMIDEDEPLGPKMQAALIDALKDVEEGRVSGPYDTMEELIDDLHEQ